MLDVVEVMIKVMGVDVKRFLFWEVYDVLQIGDVDGQENIWLNIYIQCFFVVQDGIMEINYQVFVYLVVMLWEWLVSLDNNV